MNPEVDQPKVETSGDQKPSDFQEVSGSASAVKEVLDPEAEKPALATSEPEVVAEADQGEPEANLDEAQEPVPSAAAETGCPEETLAPTTAAQEAQDPPKSEPEMQLKAETETASLTKAQAPEQVVDGEAQKITE